MKHRLQTRRKTREHLSRTILRSCVPVALAALPFARRVACYQGCVIATFSFSALALLLVLWRDLPSQTWGSSVLLFGGVGLIWLPLFLGELTGRVLALPFRLVRVLTFVALGLMPAVYASFYLVPIGFEGMKLLLAGMSVLVALVALVVWFWGRLAREAREPVRAVVPLVALVLLAAFLWPHVQEATLTAINPGSERERSLVFLGSWGATLVLGLALGIKALDRVGVAVRPLLRGLAFVTCALAGVAALEADRRIMQGHYPYFHAWLQIIGIVSLEGASSLLASALASLRPVLGRVLRWVGLGNLVTILASSVGFLFASFVPSAFPLLRARMTKVEIAPLLFELQPDSARDVLPRDEDHPLLRESLQHEVKLAGGERFNVLLITIDALRGDALKHAPRISEFAAKSALFENTYTPGTRTAMALSSMMTGRYSAHLDWELWTGGPDGMLRVNSLTQAQRDKIGPKFGYTTFPDFNKFPMLAQRMQKVGLFTMGTPYLADKAQWLRRGVGFERGFDDYTEFQSTFDPGNSSAPVMREAITQLDRAGSKRWFQWIHLFDPHTAKGSTARYRRLVKTTDDAIGELLSELERRRVLDQTVVMITGDHGEGFSRDHPRTHATSLFDDQARVPMILHVPGLAARRYGFPTSSLDGIATLLAVAGAELEGVDGLNLLPWLKETRAAPRHPVFSELHRYAKGPRTQDLKAVILGDYKLLFDRRTGFLRLFNLKRDPRELHDLSEREPERLRELAAVLGAFVHAGERLHPLL